MAASDDDSGEDRRAEWSASIMDGFPKNEAEARAAQKAIYLYARECEPRNRGWAGELLNTDAVIARFAISAQQLNKWRRSNQLICFGLSRRKRRYPAWQFTEDGGIVPAIDQILEIAGNRNSAWHWLCRPSGALGARRAIDVLKAGEIEIVLEAAHQQFDMDAGW